ncbi:GNAT family N-acetyltransferase [Blastococcus sp. TML/M2B]|uniref:GNAT family N-acetyltransferase n=1 Tax=unclassified Blastococcus TaxID=2619396 RepID=UPI00190C85F8|nr:MULTISPECIES: GNAT family N-acetyltransferase [unclassified Blastococcus]MBN1093755.1 GNAT family N-acetyltransferase [Blastococcus sp. TML/M2B]MBN1096123.1 GNAT family N-acetyltransferase [Blastococcus sp. TML/C7B]
MTPTIRPLAGCDVDAVVDLSLRAWAPVFESMRAVMGEAVFAHLYPDWSAMQAAAVAGVVRDAGTRSWVAEEGDAVTGFVAVVHHDETHGEPNSSEVEMIAVDPAAQRRGTADALLARAVEEMRAHGSVLAVIATGGDPGHAPARAAYEKAGFRPFPQLRYYRML